MKKIFTLIVILAAVIIFAVYVDKKTEITKNQQSFDSEETLTFNHKFFDIDLPAPFEADDSLIKPKREKDFPQIVYAISEITNEGTLLSFEEERQKNLCDQTDACGEIIESEEVNTNNVYGIKFTVQYDGRSIDDREGDLLEYHYSLQDGKKLFRFWTSLNDLETPEAKKKIFEEIMETFVGN